MPVALERLSGMEARSLHSSSLQRKYLHTQPEKPLSRRPHRQQSVAGMPLARRRNRTGLETVDLDGLAIQGKTLLLVREELLNVLALVSLKLNYLAHLSVRDNGAIAGELLLDDLEDLLLVELLGETLDCSQGLASIALCDMSAGVAQPRRLRA